MYWILLPAFLASDGGFLDRHVAVTVDRAGFDDDMFLCTTGTHGRVTMSFGAPVEVTTLELAPVPFGNPPAFIDVRVDDRAPVRATPDESGSTRVKIEGPAVRRISIEVPFEALPDKILRRFDYDYAFGFDIGHREIAIPKEHRRACLGMIDIRGRNGPFVLHENISAEDLVRLRDFLSALQRRPEETHLVLPMQAVAVRNATRTEREIRTLTAFRGVAGTIPDDRTLEISGTHATTSWIATPPDRDCPSGQTSHYVELTLTNEAGWRVTAVETMTLGCIDPRE